MDSMNDAKVWKNLIDAGCDSTIINDFFKIAGTDQLTKRLMLLQKHRKRLLDGIHKCQYEIDCWVNLLKYRHKINIKWILSIGTEE